jgi:hypothetical protein
VDIKNDCLDPATEYLKPDWEPKDIQYPEEEVEMQLDDAQKKIS